MRRVSRLCKKGFIVQKNVQDTHNILQHVSFAKSVENVFRSRFRQRSRTRLHQQLVKVARKRKRFADQIWL